MCQQHKGHLHLSTEDLVTFSSFSRMLTNVQQYIIPALKFTMSTQRDLSAFPKKRCFWAPSNKLKLPERLRQLATPHCCHDAAFVHVPLCSKSHWFKMTQRQQTLSLQPQGEKHLFHYSDTNMLDWRLSSFLWAIKFWASHPSV